MCALESTVVHPRDPDRCAVIRVVKLGRVRWRAGASHYLVVMATVAIIAGCAVGCGRGSATSAGSSTPKAGSQSPACQLLTASQASTLLGRSEAPAPTRVDRFGDSSCAWGSSDSSGGPSLSIFLYHKPQVVDSFRSSLAQPTPPVIRILVDGSPALWRPYPGFGTGTSFVSAASNGAVVAVEAAGDTSSLDSISRTAAGLALTALRSHAH